MAKSVTAIIADIRKKWAGEILPQLELKDPIAQEQCKHPSVCARMLPVRPQHDVPFRPWPYYEDRICPECGAHERLFHSREWMRDHFLETHPDRLFPRVHYGPFRKIDTKTYLMILDHIVTKRPE